jgi:hypothetical protein
MECNEGMVYVQPNLTKRTLLSWCSCITTASSKINFFFPSGYGLQIYLVLLMMAVTRRRVETSGAHVT